MSYVAACLLLQFEEADAFVCFANVLNMPLHYAFYRLDELSVRVQFLPYSL